MESMPERRARRDGALPEPRRWCITGVAGFIGSHLLERLLAADQEVAGLDNLSTGHRTNLDEVRRRVTPAQWARFRFHEGDIRRREDVSRVVTGAERVLHQAALVSVPLSIAEPVQAHDINVTGFLNVLEAARAAGVSRVVYASSSAVYGDATDLPAREDRIGSPLSAYALSKRMDEEYAALYERCYGQVSVGLRYFNVFGARQDPEGAYAAVIPRWTLAWLRDEPVTIHGDGGATRDFCPVQAVVEANLRAALADLPPEAPRVFNVGLGEATSLNTLAEHLRREVVRHHPAAAGRPAQHGPERAGDIRHSCADVSAARRWLGWSHEGGFQAGLPEVVQWFAGGRRSVGAAAREDGPSKVRLAPCATTSNPGAKTFGQDEQDGQDSPIPA
jgi:UDP-N-acetylglucosamine 4-epimerase